MQALENHSSEQIWWIDPKSGEVVLYSDWNESQGEPDPETRGLTPIDPVSSVEGYADMEDFIAQVRDPRARDLLGRAIEGRGAFRRFKDTLYDFPALRQARTTRSSRRCRSGEADLGARRPVLIRAQAEGLTVA